GERDVRGLVASRLEMKLPEESGRCNKKVSPAAKRTAPAMRSRLRGPAAAHRLRGRCYNNSMTAHPDVLILGGGVIGLSTAYFLARDGARVAVVDKGDFGQEASWAGAGILPGGNPKRAKSALGQLRAHSIALFPEISAEMRSRTGIDNGYVRCGG